MTVAALAAERQRKVGLNRIALGLPSNPLGDAVLMKRLVSLAKTHGYMLYCRTSAIWSLPQSGVAQEQLHVLRSGRLGGLYARM